MTIRQVAIALGLKVRTIREWIKTGRLEATKLSDGHWYIDEALIETKEVKERADKGREHSRRIKEGKAMGMLEGGSKDTHKSVYRAKRKK